MEAHLKQTISGFGGFPVEECSVYRPQKRRGIGEILSSGEQSSYIARGLGRSYGDTSLNGGAGVVNITRLNRMLDFTPSTGVLHCESGVTFKEIIDTFLPRGYFLPVTPGTKYVTVGGAIANDVHGKNHGHSGTFGQSVIEIELLTPAGEILVCTPEENADVFWATLGGIGLTGFILTTRFKLQPVESAYMKVDYTRLKDIDALMSALDESEGRHQYSVAWIDCLAKGKDKGRSVLMLGDHATAEDLATSIRDPYAIGKKFQKVVPFNMPSFVLNPFSVSLFNAAVYASYPTVEGKIVDYDSYFYPLDSVLHFNRVYGKQGLIQYQATFPVEGRAGLLQVLDRLNKASRASFLAVLKRTGPANPAPLSHPIEGYLLNLDIPYRQGIVEFLHDLDMILLNHGARLYLAKDAVMTADTFAKMYPRRDEFMEIRHRLDPNQVLSSTMARRVGLAETSQAVFAGMGA